MRLLHGFRLVIESIVARFESSVCDEFMSAMSLQRTRNDLALQSYLELLRLPNVFTAVADVAMGFFFVQAAWAFSDDGQQSLLPIAIWTIGLLAAASALLYSAGMVLERRLRHRTRSRGTALSAAAFGPHPAELGPLARLATADPGDHAGQRHGGDAGEGSCRPTRITSSLPGGRRSSPPRLAVLIVLYNAGLKRTPLGPVAMGGCRMLNVLLGMSVLRGPWRIEHWAVAAGIGVYIAGVTWFARNDARRSDRRQLIAATLVMLAGVGLVGGLPWLSDKLWMLGSAAARVVALVLRSLPCWPDSSWRSCVRRLPSRRPDRCVPRSAVRSRP